jgi:hypothetical protein
MPMPIACPGCGWTENGPDNLTGKRLKCKRCQQSFVVGGGAAKPGAAKSTGSNSDVEFDELEMRALPVRRRARPKSMTPVVGMFVIALLLGAGGAAGYLWYTKPAAADDSASTKSDKPANFTWISTGAEKPKDGKSKDVMDLPFDEKDLPDIKPKEK